MKTMNEEKLSLGEKDQLLLNAFRRYQSLKSRLKEDAKQNPHQKEKLLQYYLDDLVEYSRLNNRLCEYMVLIHGKDTGIRCAETAFFDYKNNKTGRSIFLEEAFLRSLVAEGLEIIKSYGLPHSDYTKRLSEVDRRYGGKGITERLDLPAPSTSGVILPDTASHRPAMARSSDGKYGLERITERYNKMVSPVYQQAAASLAF